MHTISSIMLATIVALSAVSLSATTSSVLAQEEPAATFSGEFAEVTTTQEGDQIVITITRADGEPPEGAPELPETPEGPIIIVPDPGGDGNGTVILPPPANESGVPPPQNITIIEPDGNVTQIEPPSNVTVIDNDTAVITPPEDWIGETPGDAVVIEPPKCDCVAGEQPPEPGPEVPPSIGEGGAGEENATSSLPEQLPPFVSNNTNITITDEPTQPPIGAQLPSFDGDGGSGNGDGNGDGDN